MKEITIRKAVASDFAAILEMSEGIYSGHDYFPCVFHQWLAKTNRTIFVAQYGDKLVGLRAVHIVDEGKTFISQGLRIHPRFRGLGLSTRLIDAIHQHIRREYPKVYRERFTTKSDNIERLAIQKKYGDTALCERDILAFYVNRESLKPHHLEEASNICLSGKKFLLGFMSFSLYGKVLKMCPKMAAESPLRGPKPRWWPQR